MIASFLPMFAEEDWQGMVGGAQGRGVEGLVACCWGWRVRGWARKTMKIKNSVLILCFREN